MNVEGSLTILSHKIGISSIQKCYLPSNTLDLQKRCKHGTYALLKISPCVYSVCELYWRSVTHPSFCHLDDSVICFSMCKKTLSVFPKESLNRTFKYLSLQQLQIISTCIPIKELHLSIIFGNVSDRKKWEGNIAILEDIVKCILKLYIIVKDSVVFLKHLTPSQRFGIHCIVIHDTVNVDKNVTAVGRIVSSTNIKIFSKLSLLWIEQLQNSPAKIFLGGLDKHYQTLQEIINQQRIYREAPQKLQIRPSRQVLLVGPPGCGKTSLVRSVVANCGAVLVSILGPEVFQSRPGDTEGWLRQVFEEATALAEEGTSIGGLCVLLLDEVDSICPKRGGGGTSSHQARVTAQLLSLLERADNVRGLVVIATTNRPSALDPAIRRPGRLENEVHIGVPTEFERRQILEVLMSSLLGCNMTFPYHEVARLTPGYVGADLSLLCHRVVLDRNKMQNANITVEDFLAVIATMRPSSLRGGLGVVTTRKIEMSEIGGLDCIKQSLRTAVEWPLLHPEAFARFSLPHTKGVLLYGPPGCAKTSLVRGLTSAMNVTFLSISAAELYSPYVGDAEKSIGELFHRARLGAPTILFIDEIDALVGSRGHLRERGVQERVLSALLTEMDGIGVQIDSFSSNSAKSSQINTGVTVIAATNRPDMLDDALLRPGRFDKLLYIPPPDPACRLDILRVLTANMPLGSCVDLEFLASSTDLFSGADLSNLCKEAALYALTEDGMDVNQIKQKHFIHVLGQIRPSLSEQQIRWYSSYKK